MEKHGDLILVSTGPLRHVYIRSNGSDAYLYNNKDQVGLGVLDREDLRYQFDLLSYSGYITSNGEPTKADFHLIRHAQDVPVGFPARFLYADPDHTLTLKAAPASMVNLPDGNKQIQLPVKPCDDTGFCLDNALFISTNVNETDNLQWKHFVFLESFVSKGYYVSETKERCLALEKCSEGELPFKNNLKFDLIEIDN